MITQEQSVPKILMTADPVGGVWTYAMDLCRAYDALGIKVCLATMGCCLSERQHSEVRSVANIDLRESAFKLEWMDDPWSDVAAAGEWLLNLEREVEPDLVHLNGYMHAVLNWKAPVVVVAHSCVLSWWQGVLNTPAPAAWDEYKQRVAAGLKAADAVVAISKTYAAELQRLYGHVDNIEIVYNGRDPRSFYANSKQQQVFAMGRIWDEAKNLQILGELKNPLQLPILIAGDNTDPNTSEEVHINNVTLLGKLSQQEVRSQLAASQFYVLPAKYEPFGLSALEAALSGCLLLLADNPTLMELWQDTALYFNPDRPEEVDALLQYAFSNPEETEAYIKRSTEHAQQFSLEHMTNNYLSLYQRLVQSKLVSQPNSNK